MFSLLICGQVQSRIGPGSSKYFQNLRQLLPDIEIVVSTWAGEFNNNDKKFIDLLITNPDPGDSKYGKNWNRILISTKTAIRQSSGDFLIRSRVEVEISDGCKFNDLLTIISQETTPRIYFPARVSQYSYEKGLIYAWPDFFHIAQSNLLSQYWDSDLSPNQRNRFHMNTGHFNSLSSDQVIGLNFSGKESKLDYFSNRNTFSKQNWITFRNVQKKYMLFFDEHMFGLDFGRLQRSSNFTKYKSNIMSPSLLPIGNENMGNFLFRRFYKQLIRKLHQIKNLINISRKA